MLMDIHRERRRYMNLNEKSSARLIAVAAISALILTLGPIQSGADDNPQDRQESKRPNTPHMLADENGYSDLGSYGGEINTPVYLMLY